MTRGPSTDASAEALDTTMRLAVLLGAGLSPQNAWAALAERGGAAAIAAADAATRGDDVGKALRAIGGPWPGVAAVYTVAVGSGAPLAATLRGIVGALRDTTEIAADVHVALAEPAATARLLAWLPLLGVPMGLALGFDTIGILLTDSLGTPCLIVGGVLVVVSRVWSARLVRTARPGSEIPGLTAELWAVALSAGISVDRAEALVAETRSHVDLDGGTREDVAIEHTLALAVRTGVPAVELLRGDAWLARHRARREGRAAAARLSTRLLVPLGVCTLPAFLLLAVVPLMVGVMRSSALP